MKNLVDEVSKVLQKWMKQEKIVTCDPRHLIFSIWATTQHYADFDAQVQVVLGEAGKGNDRFDDAARFLDQLFVDGLRPR